MTASIVGSSGGGRPRGCGSDGGGSDGSGSGVGSNGGDAGVCGASSSSDSSGSASTSSDGGRSRAVEAVLAMLSAASDGTHQEVYALLSAALHAPSTAAQLRVHELGFLSSLLIGDVEEGFDFRQCERSYYDEVRPKTAPSSRHLADVYGSWSRACRAAYGLRADGTSTGPGKPWPTTNRGGPMGTDYTREEAIAAVRLCANELSAAGLVGVPTSWQYDEWVRRRKLEAKKRGQKLRLPYARAIYLKFHQRARGRSRWQAIIEATGLDAESDLRLLAAASSCQKNGDDHDQDAYTQHDA